MSKLSLQGSPGYLIGASPGRMFLKSLIYVGDKRVHPLGCLPLRGREGATS